MDKNGWMAPSSAGLWRCKHPELQKDPDVDLVTGTPMPIDVVYCVTARELGKRCGVGGDLFEPKEKS